MSTVLRWLYSHLVLPVVYFILWIAQVFFHKVADRFKGEKMTLNFLRQFRRSTDTCLLWFHASSMGEFEQAKPVIEQLKRHHPEWIIAATFFSPSGYRYQSAYEHIDIALYLPFDFPRRMRFFVQKLQPDLAVFVRYDLWPNLIEELYHHRVPVMVICATLNSQAIGWKFPFRKLTAQMYARCTLILSAGEEQTERFRTYVPTATVETAGDPRFDRVAQVVQEAASIDILPSELLAAAELTVILGSSWEEEENLVYQVLDEHPELKERLTLIIVPHEPIAEHVSSLRGMFPDAVCYSELDRWDGQPTRYLIVDVVGKLLYLYRYADCAIVGGGFGNGVHSVVEAAGYGLPLATGPNIQHSRDALALEQRGVLRIVRKPEELYRWIKQMLDPMQRQAQEQKVRQYFLQHQGATQVIVRRITALIRQMTVGKQDGNVTSCSESRHCH